MSEIKPVPQTVNHHNVLAAIRTGNDQYVVICEDARKGWNPYITWKVAWNEDDSTWFAENGHYDMSWSQALGDFVKRSNLVPDDYWTWMQQNTESLSSLRR